MYYIDRKFIVFWKIPQIIWSLILVKYHIQDTRRMLIISTTTSEFTFDRRCPIILMGKPIHSTCWLLTSVGYFFFYCYHFCYRNAVEQTDLTTDSDLISPETVGRPLEFWDTRARWLSFNLFFFQHVYWQKFVLT